MSMQPISYLSRLAEGGGNRRFLTPPRVLFRPVLPANPGLSEIESVIGSSQPPTITPTADRTVSRKSSQTASITVQDSSASALPTMFNVIQVKQSLHHAMDTESAIMRPTRFIGPQPRRTNVLNLEPAPVATGIINEVNRPSTRPARNSAPDSIIDKTLDAEQARIVHSRPVVPRREPQRQATTVIEEWGRTAASIQEDARKKQKPSMSSGNETDHSHRIFLTPLVPVTSERSAHRAEKREKSGSGSSPAIHIGTLEVRVNPVAIPQRIISRNASAPRPVAPLAQGFRSFGLAQG